jgi:hypothetical protein
MFSKGQSLAQILHFEGQGMTAARLQLKRLESCPFQLKACSSAKQTHMITNTKRLSFSLSLSEKLVVSRFSGLKSLKHGHQMSCDYCPFALQFNAQPFLLSSKFAHFLHLLIVNLAQGAELAGQNWRKDLLSFFHGSQCVTTMFPFEFPMGSQCVPQHVLHSTSLLSHLLCQLCRWVGKGE